MKYKYIAYIVLILSSHIQAENYFEKYGKKYNVPPQILWAIAKQESNFNPNAINRNKNGSTDIGLMQINTIHLDDLAKYGIGMKHLFNPEISIAVGAKILSSCFKKHGQNYKGLNCYNGRLKNNSYSNKIVSHLKKKQKTTTKLVSK